MRIPPDYRRETTQEFLSRLLEHYENYTSKLGKDLSTTKEKLKLDYDRFKYIYETLDVRELCLIFFLRNSGDLVKRIFFDIAKKQYESFNELISFHNDYID